MAYKKPQNPLTNNGFGIYPLTTADQVILSDGSRLEKNGLVTSSNSDKLGGVAANSYALKTDTAPDSNKLGGKTLAEIMLALYPVGTVYISANSTSPSSLFGGTWEQMKDRFLLGAGDSYAAGGTGGEETHTLTIDEIPAHRHAIYMNGESSNGEFWGPNVVTPQNKTIANATDTSGGNHPHNNMPPYLVVYMWKRVS